MKKLIALACLVAVFAAGMPSLAHARTVHHRHHRHHRHHTVHHAH